MIAPAMNTRPQETLSYRDLARQQARISRQIGLESLERLQALVPEPDTSAAAANSTADFDVTLEFSVDPVGLCRVDGTVDGRIRLNCHGCAEELPHDLSLSFACVIAETEAIADGLREGEDVLPVDVLVANGPEISIVQIIEDEILLSLPERLCLSDPCERAPGLEYPALGHEAGDTEAAEDEENPFSVLRGLKTEKSSQS